MCLLLLVHVVGAIFITTAYAKCLSFFFLLCYVFIYFDLTFFFLSILSNFHLKTNNNNSKQETWLPGVEIPEFGALKPIHMNIIFCTNVPLHTDEIRYSFESGWCLLIALFFPTSVILIFTEFYALMFCCRLYNISFDIIL